MKNIAFFFGGKSLEHDVSVVTGVMAVNSLDKEQYNAVPVYIDKDGTWYTGEALKDIGFYKDINYKSLQKVSLVAGDNIMYSIRKKKIKALFTLSAAVNCLHGENGEDGSLFGFLQLCYVPVTSSPLFASSCCMDKGYTKTVLKGLFVPFIRSVVVESPHEINKLKIKNITFPIIVKPCCAGSSIGIKKVNNEDELNSAINEALRFGSRVLIEPFVENFVEINCAAFRGKDGKLYVSECERPIAKENILSFSDKYINGEREFPAKIPEQLSVRIKKLTEKIYKGIGAFGVIRVDYMVIGEKIYVNEINTVPGSLAYYLFCDTPSEFTLMLNEMISATLSRFAKEQTETKIFETNVLATAGGKSSKRL